MKLPRRIAHCKNCGHRFDVDSDVLIFLGLGILLGIFLVLLFCPPAHAQTQPWVRATPLPCLALVLLESRA